MLCKGKWLPHLVRTFRSFSYPHDISIFVRQLLGQHSTERHATLRSVRELTKNGCKLCQTNANLNTTNALDFFLFSTRPVERSAFHKRVQVEGNSNAVRYTNSSWLRRLVACLLPRRPGFDPGSVHVGFVVDKVALGQVFPRVLRFSPVNITPLVLHY
jgi:hypothetical protein